MLATIVNGHGVTEHRRADNRAARPSLDHVLGSLFILGINLLEKMAVNEWTLFETAWHFDNS